MVEVSTTRTTTQARHFERDDNLSHMRAEIEFSQRFEREWENASDTKKMRLMKESEEYSCARPTSLLQKTQKLPSPLCVPEPPVKLPGFRKVLMGTGSKWDLHQIRKNCHIAFWQFNLNSVRTPFTADLINTFR